MNDSTLWNIVIVIFNDHFEMSLTNEYFLGHSWKTVMEDDAKRTTKEPLTVKLVEVKAKKKLIIS